MSPSEREGFPPEPELDLGIALSPEPVQPRNPGVRRFRKRAVEIEAIQWTGRNADEVSAFAVDCFGLTNDDPGITAEVYDDLHLTWVSMKDGQWVIKGLKGEFYPSDDEVFRQTYDPAPLPFGENPPTHSCGCGPDGACEQHLVPDPAESEALMDARDRITESNQARRDERASILAAARQAVVTFTRPGLGNGPEHGQHVKVVPWVVLEELLGAEKPQ